MRPSVAGFLVWLAPFVVSCFFIGPDGKKTIEDGLFKNIMISVGGFTSSVLIYTASPRRHEGLQMAAAAGHQLGPQFPCARTALCCAGF